MRPGFVDFIKFILILFILFNEALICGFFNFFKLYLYILMKLRFVGF